MTSHPLVAISNLLEPVEQRWVQGHPRDVVAGAGSNVPAPGEQRWVRGHPRDVVAAAILSAGLDEPACGAQRHLFPAPVNGAGNWDVPMRHGWGTERQPRGDFLFPHLANTPTHLLLLEALHRVKRDPLVTPPAGVSHRTVTKQMIAHTPLNAAMKEAAPKVIVDDGFVYLVTHYPIYSDGATNNKCWVKECKARVKYNLATKEVVRNDTEHLGSQCGVNEYLKSKKRKSDIADIEVRLSEMLHDDPFLKPDAAYQKLLQMKV